MRNIHIITWEDVATWLIVITAIGILCYIIGFYIGSEQEAGRVIGEMDDLIEDAQGLSDRMEQVFHVEHD